MLRKVCPGYMTVFAFALTAMLVDCSTAEAQLKAFKISGAGVGPTGLPLPGQPARMHWVVGNATHLGQHYGEGTVQTDAAAFHGPEGGLPTHITGGFGSGTEGFTFTAANGDKLACQYGRIEKGASQPGSFTLTVLSVTGAGLLVEADWTAEFVVQPEECTGRFKGVTGSWIMYAQSEPFILGSDGPVYYSWEGLGSLTFPKKKP